MYIYIYTYMYVYTHRAEEGDAGLMALLKTLVRDTRKTNPEKSAPPKLLPLSPAPGFSVKGAVGCRV